MQGGAYHVVLPDAPSAATPSLVMLHGWGSSGAGAMRNRGLVDAALARGYAVIAPDGVPRSQGRSGRTWGFHPNLPAPRDEVSFLRAVADDAAQRFGLDRSRMILAGFSMGGSMTTYQACADPTSFAAFAPIGGGFWRPHPQSCVGPVRLLLTHGWTDVTVPLEGRVLRGRDDQDPDALMQGDIFETLRVLRAANACRQLRADRFDLSERFWRRAWDRCAPGTALELALFPGGHRIPIGWLDMALDWFEQPLP